MKKRFIVLIHVIFSTFGQLEYCLSKGIRKFRTNLDSHYSSRITCQHPAYHDVLISISRNSQEPHLNSYMLCKDLANGIPQYVTGTLSLN